MRTNTIRASSMLAALLWMTPHASFGEGSRGTFSRPEARVDAPTTTKADELGEDLRRQIEELKIAEMRKGPRFALSGKIERADDGAYAINGETFVVDSTTQIQGTLSIGAQAEVTGSLGPPKIAELVIVPDGAPSASSDESPSEFGSPPPQ